MAPASGRQERAMIAAYTTIQRKPEGILNRLFKVLAVFFREDKSHLPHPDYGFYELERKGKSEPS
jgi:hypothetical protein